MSWTMSNLLKALYTEHPWLKDTMTALEAKVSDLQSEVTNLQSDVEELEDTVEDMEKLEAQKDQAVRSANADYVSLYSRYTKLIAICRALMRQDKELDNE
jgi:peptidoglycan hydrolase CwlO-like protein